VNSRYVGFGYSVLDRKGQYPQLQYGSDKEVLQCFSLISPKEYYEAPEAFLSDGAESGNSLNLIGAPRSFSIASNTLMAHERQFLSRGMQFGRRRQNCRRATPSVRKNSSAQLRSTPCLVAPEFDYATHLQEAQPYPQRLLRQEKNERQGPCVDLAGSKT
jgi:hypothetical protein